MYKPGRLRGKVQRCVSEEESTFWDRGVRFGRWEICSSQGTATFLQNISKMLFRSYSSASINTIICLSLRSSGTMKYLLPGDSYCSIPRTDSTGDSGVKSWNIGSRENISVHCCQQAGSVNDNFKVSPLKTAKPFDDYLKALLFKLLSLYQSQHCYVEEELLYHVKTFCAV